MKLMFDYIKKGDKFIYRAGHLVYWECVSDEYQYGNGKRKDIGIACVPGELFEDIGKAILEHSVVGKENTFIFQNSQDWIAYLFPMNEYIEVGGYEPLPSFSPLAGLIIESG